MKCRRKTLREALTAGSPFYLLIFHILMSVPEVNIHLSSIGLELQVNSYKEKSQYHDSFLLAPSFVSRKKELITDIKH